ncbi:MAG: lamin tail domain-containing protein [Actinomycetota bacterium]|nr:lamin tail domain-containing protein [Actinomycetota bacterium]
MVRSVLAAPRKRLLALVLLLVAVSSAVAATAPAASTNVVISEFRVRGPNGGNDEFVELYNLSGSPVSIGGWKIRGSNSAGTVSTRATITAGTTLAAGCHYLVTNASATAGPYSGAVPGDQTYTTGITDDGGVAVTLADDTVVDQVGMSTGSAFKEGTPVANLGTTNLDRSYERKPGGAAGSGTDTDNNSADFQLISPSAPQSSAPAHCIGGVTSTPPSGTGAATPSSVAPGGSSLLTVAVTPGSNPTSTGLAVSGDLTPIGGSATQAFFDDGSNGDAAAGDGTFSYQATVASGTSPGAKTLSTSISDAQGRSGSAPITLTVTPPLVQIGQVQGATHLSPYSGQLVKVEGVVIAERGSNTWIQDVSPDADPATSEAILVFGSTVSNAVVVGDLVQVSGTVTEFRAGCTPSCAPTASAFSNLTITQLAAPGLGVAKLGTAGLPAPTVIGARPTEIIENDSATGNVETGNSFDPAQDGIDFYETLEHMRVQVNNPVVVGPRNGFGEIVTLADGGAGASVRTVRGGILVRDVDPATLGDYGNGDFNPERIMLDDLFVATPMVDVADSFSAAAGVLTYDFANFKIAVTSILAEIDGGLQREVTRAPRDQEIVAGTYNVENLDPSDGSFAEHAELIVNHLRSPDVLAIEEIQDNDGAANTTVTDASVTWNTLIAAIQAAGGPLYEYRQIDPVDDQDGGEPGGNIRVGFLFRTDRGLEFVDRPGGDSTTPTTVVGHPSGPQLSFSPGRVDPQNPAYNSSRKPLAGEFRMHGRKVFVIATHFSSKGGDQPLFGRFQPQARSSEVARHAQARSVRDFVAGIRALDPDANVILAGDINDFEFSETVAILEESGLTSLMETLPQAERYSYVFEGNSQVLDQILVTPNLLSNFGIDYDPVHVNAEFADQASDHDPQVARLDLRGRPGPK